MAVNLSDRIIKSAEDIQKKINESEFVQNVLMTGELSGKHLALVHKAYKRNLDIEQVFKSYFEETLKLSGHTQQEKDFYVSLISHQNSMVNFFADLTEAVGPVPKDVLSGPINPGVEEYMKRYYTGVNEGSVIKCLVSNMAALYGLVSLHNYLEGCPLYRENALAKLLTFKSMGLEQALVAVKGFVDSRAKEVDPKLEAQLVALYRTTAEGQLAARWLL